MKNGGNEIEIFCAILSIKARPIRAIALRQFFPGVDNRQIADECECKFNEICNLF